MSRVVICALAKNEHLYINEWVNHYVKLGVDKIYLYDNDNETSPYIGDYIDRKDKVEIINYRGVQRPKLQHDIYTEFYNTHEFDWCLFCDIDEFLFGVKNIHEFVSRPQFRHINQIRIKWRLFGDNELIKRDTSVPVVKAFTKEVINSLNRNLIDKGNLENQGKAMVRGGLKNVVVRSPHFASINRRDNVIPSVLPSGKPCFSKVVIKENYIHETVFLHHYMTKSLDEFIKQKLNRTDAVFGDTLQFNYYWRINKKTEKKLNYLRSLGYEL